ncbi:MAG: CaiB/BaiF CoA transferase family protein [Ktedonobacteraceae bacterium]
MLNDALAGFRCIDFSWVFAGPYAGQLLGDLGMEMIKIESRKRMDVVRSYPPFAFEDRRLNSSGYWNTHNRSKYSVNLDMKSEKARELVAQLIAKSDLVLENFSARGMKAIGFDYERLREINPSIIYCSMAGFGHRGPYKNYVAYGPMQESQAGIVNLTGWTDDQPSRVGTSYPDAAGGVSAAFMIAGALRHAKRTGQGQWIDLGQTLTSAALTDTAVIEYSVNGDIQQRNGDYHRFFAPHNVYPCSGDDQWCAISVENESEFAALAATIGQPELVSDVCFATNAARLQNRQELDEIISQWTVRNSHYEVMHKLQAAEVAAGAVLGTGEFVEDEHIKARGFMESFDHPVVGEKLYPGVPFKMSLTPGYIHRPAPCLGADTEYVFKNLLGLSDEHIKQLDDEGILM